MKKKFILSLALLIVMLSTGAVLASQTLNDLGTSPPYTASQEWIGVTGPANNNNYDVIGANNFATNQMTVNAVGQLQIQLLTNMPAQGITLSGGNTFFAADIGLSATSATANYNAYTSSSAFFTGLTSPYELGIDMSGYFLSGSGTSGTGTATLEKVTTWGTSYSKVNPLGVAWAYGGAWRQSNDLNPFTKPVETKIEVAGDVLATGTLEWHKVGTYGGYDQFLVTILFSGYNDLFNTPFDVIWGTATCANDVVAGHIDAQVPIPSTALLLGTGLLGLLGLRRLRKV